ncbi:hypothetical protein L6452_08804 [Arctium lappa]|uniref:Uncharacterized protein n=1 Tax=Arctium lappa TaxID=4217 RepID=A0ACB9DJ44_ARCLA|nr:hypothetical protein L6452_08804 [Arctium lappa]
MDKLNGQYQNREYLKLVGSSSFRLPERPIEHVIPIQLVLDREVGSAHHAVKFSSSVKKMNITALTSMFTKSIRRMFMFGPRFLLSFLEELSTLGIPAIDILPGWTWGSIVTVTESPMSSIAHPRKSKPGPKLDTVARANDSTEVVPKNLHCEVGDRRDDTLRKGAER